MRIFEMWRNCVLHVTHHGMARLQIASGDAGSTHGEKLVVVRWLSWLQLQRAGSMGILWKGIIAK